MKETLNVVSVKMFDRRCSFLRQISKGFEGIPSNVDAAFVWSGNDKIYFFKVSPHKKEQTRTDSVQDLWRDNDAEYGE